MTSDLFRSAFDKLKMLATLFLASSAAVSFYFVGVFVYFGLELMTLIDKQSLFEAILFYSALFSVALAITTLLTAPFSGNREPPSIEATALDPGTSLLGDDRRSWLSAINKLNDRVRELETALRTLKADAMREASRWRHALQQYVRQLLPAALVALLIVVIWLLHVWKGVVFIAIVAVLAMTGFAARRFIYQISLLAFFLLGFIRADFLMEAQPGIAIFEAGDSARMTEASMILSSSRGVLAVVDGDNGGGRRARFVPWDKIGRVEINPKAPRVFSAGFFVSLTKRPTCLPLRVACYF